MAQNCAYPPLSPGMMALSSLSDSSEGTHAVPVNTAIAALRAGKGGIVDSEGPPGLGSAPTLIHEPGGEVVAKCKHPTFTTFERQWRKLPEEGWFAPTVNNSRPIIFEIGSFTVPRDQVLWLFDYWFSVYRPSGQDAGDFQLAEVGRFSNQMGFDLMVGNNNRPGDIRYELDPTPITVDRTAFETQVMVRATAGAFQRAAANSFALTAGPATALLPVRREVQGPQNGPFTYIVEPGRTVVAMCIIFNRIRAPLACVQANIAGYRFSSTLSSTLVNRVRPK